MNTNIEPILKKIGTLLKNTTDIAVTDSDLLAYVENRLAPADRQAVEKFLLTSPEMVDEILLLKKLISVKPAQKVPYRLHQNILRALGLEEKYVMQLVLKKVKSAIEIVKGRSYFRPQLGLSLVPTRGAMKGLYVFQSHLEPYLISCRIQAEEERQFLYFTVENADGGAVKNGRFRIKKSGKPVYEIVTDGTGATPVKPLTPGDHEIVFSIGRKNLGTLKLTLS